MWLWVYLFLIQHRFEFGVYQCGEVVGCLCQGSLTSTTEEVARLRYFRDYLTGDRHDCQPYGRTFRY